MLLSIAASLAFLVGLTTTCIQSTICSTFPIPEEPTLDSLIVSAKVVQCEVFYVGINNYLDLEVSGAAATDLEVTTPNVLHTIQHEDNNRYLVYCTKVGKMTIDIRDKRTGKRAQTTILVKRIRDPVVQLGNSSGGTIKAAYFRAQVGLIALIEGMDMMGQCKIQSFELFYGSNGQDPVSMRQNGGAFTGAVRQAVAQAKAGDQYIFTNVVGRCPGDVAGRRLNGLVFNIR